MKKFIEYVGENDVGIILVSLCIGVIIAVIMITNRLTISEEEKECYDYYKENKYVLDNCKKWSEKYE